MVTFQIPMPGLARGFNSLSPEENDFIRYFSCVDQNCMAPVLSHYAGIEPKGYGTSLILARIIKVKERILSDRQLARVLRQNDLYRFVTRDIQPTHNTFNTLRRRLGPQGFIEIHKRFVGKAHSLGLLDIEIKTLPCSISLSLHVYESFFLPYSWGVGSVAAIIVDHLRRLCVTNNN